jgi:nucleotide-binding universal stress UspA family protein
MDGAVKAMGTAAGVTCESHILEHQSPEMAIIDFLKESGADVVVVGRSGHTVKKLKHYLIGSTAERLIHRSPCSVLTVPCLD